MEVSTIPGINEKSESKSINVEHASSKLGMCEVCAVCDGKYTCPRCEVKTCSLKCNKIHKAELECNGQRDRTKFIPLNKFSNLDLSSDYRLLEEVYRSLETSKKKFGKIWDNKPHHLYKLGSAARLRRVNLKFLPYKFARRRHNTTFLEFGNNVIYWHIQWIFVNAENLKLYDEKVIETAKVGSVLSKYLGSQTDEYLSEKLQYYQAAGLPGIKLFLKAEQRPGKKFYELDPSVTLKESLQKKLIIEYPIIHVVLKDHSCAYSAIDSDDEEEVGRAKSGAEVVNNIIKNADNNGSSYRSQKNLLFVTEYSEDELSSDE